MRAVLIRQAMTDRCEECGESVPDWPVGWLFTDDGRCFCPSHKGDRRFRTSGSEGSVTE